MNTPLSIKLGGGEGSQPPTVSALASATTSSYISKLNKDKARAHTCYVEV